MIAGNPRKKGRYIIMKKMTIAALCVVAAVALTACGQGTSSKTDSGKQAVSSAESKVEESKADASKAAESKAAESTVKEGLSDVETPEIEITDESKEDESTSLLGGWTSAESPVVTKELLAKFEKATETLTGMQYVPVAYLGSQIVNGTNHAYLCRIAATVPDSVETYAIVTLYETLDGDISISKVEESGRETDLSELPGGWFASESVEVSDEAKTALEKAAAELDGAEYEAVAELSSQVVAGKNYCLLCKVTPVVPNAQSKYTLVYVYVDLDGNAEITETVDFVEEEYNEEDWSDIGVPNPFDEYASMEEAAAAAGFPMTVPESVQGYSERIIQAIQNDLLEVMYIEGDSRLSVRKGVDAGDISGDYNKYSDVKQIAVGNRNVLLKGDGKKVFTAIWTDGDYSYAITADDGMTEAAMTELIGQVS